MKGSQSSPAELGSLRFAHAPGWLGWRLSWALSLLVGISLSAADQGSAGVRPAVALGSDGETGGGGSFAPTFSGDSRHVVFLSGANNLVTNDNRLPWIDVFLRSIGEERTQLVSVNFSGTGGGDGNSWGATVSRDGRFVAFVSEAQDLTDLALTSRWAQVYVRDTLTGITRLASVSTDGAPADGPSFSPRLSDDGRFVVFETEASNLVAEDKNRAKDVFVRDLVAERTFLVSEAFGSGHTASGVSDSPRITADGRWVLFRSEATNLTALASGDLARSEIYLREIPAGSTRRISEPSMSEASDPALARSSAVGAELTDDGRFVAYKLVSKLNTAVGVVLTDLTVPNRYWVHRWEPGNVLFTSSPLAISPADGSLVCEVSYRFSVLAQQDYLVLRLSPTERADCEPTPLGIPASLLLGFAHSAVDPLQQFRCFDAQPLADIVGGRIRYNGIRPNAARDGRRVLLAHTLWIRTTDSLFSVEERTPPSGDDGSEVLDGAVLYDLVTGERKLFPLFASPLSLTLSPDGEWLAFDSPVPDRAVADLNAASDVYLLHVGSSSPALISKRLPELPSHRRWPTAQPAIRGLDATGSRIVNLGQWPRLPGFPANLLYRDLFLHDSAPLRKLPITSYPLGSPGAVPAIQPSLRSNIVIQAKLGADGRFLTALIQSPERIPFAPESSDASLWSYDLEGATRTRIGIQPFEGLRQESIFDVDEAGRTIVYATTLPGGVPEDQDAVSDIYLFEVDHPERRTRLSQPHTGVLQQGRGHSFQPFLSPNARWVVFTSLAGDLSARPQTRDIKRLWLHDLVSHENSLLIDRMPGGDVNLAEFSWSADSSRFVLRLSDSRCFAGDPVTRTLASLGNDLQELQISREGRFVAGTQLPELGTSANSQVVRLDLTTGTRALVSLAQDDVTPGNGHSRLPQISPDGTQIYFSSEATNLVREDSDRRPDVFLRDVGAGRTTLLSRSFDTGRAANGVSTRPQLSRDGRTLLFQSSASDLMPNDFDNREDLFLIRFSPEDADGDGLPDDWERRYFGQLTMADAHSDSDGDGVLDSDEFELALNPTDPLSRVSLQALSFDPQVGFRFRWEANPWGDFTIQSADSLIAPNWRKVEGITGLLRGSGEGIDTNAISAPGRFYRIQPER